MRDTQSLMQTTVPFLTDGGFETWMFFVEGFEAPEFAAIVLMDDPAARARMRDYFERFLAMAERAGTGFVLDTNTWRGAVGWGPKLGLTGDDMLRLSRDAVAFAQSIRADWRDRVRPIVLNGVLGPAGDGYDAAGAPSAEQATALHAPQIATLADAGVDMISAITMTNTAEAIGIVREVERHRLSSVISYTVETDGRLPTGQPLGEAIAETDSATGSAPLYYMVNCAHPDHFRHLFKQGEDWPRRVGGVRANASRMSHAELDQAETLDDGDPDEFGEDHAALLAMLPHLRVFGGCCGTDHRHVGCVSDHVHHKRAAA